MRPSRISSLRSAICARDSLWVTMTNVCPYCSRKSRNRWWSWSALRLSKLPEGSSANTTEGRFLSVRVLWLRAAVPPDSSDGRCEERCESFIKSSNCDACFDASFMLRPPMSAGRQMFSNAVNSGNRRWNWNMNPIFSLRNRDSRLSSIVSVRTRLSTPTIPPRPLP